MQEQCKNCFKHYELTLGLCPHCGYMSGESGKELYYLMPGTVLHERYIIGEAVGAGGFGITYRAWDMTLNTMIAIKEFFQPSIMTRVPGEKAVVVYSKKRTGEYKKALRLFLREARTTSLFSGDEKFCDTYDYFEENGTAYMVMEFLKGKTLKDHIKQRKENFSEEEVINIAGQLLLGLKEIHKKGIVHRDIAPDNIWVTPEGKVKILDFGAAYLGEKETEEVDVVLKPGFAPPEQYRGRERYASWTDIYALGATLYVMLTGAIPIEGSDREKEDMLPSPRELVGTSENLNNVVMRAMAVEKELRYQNTETFMNDLRAERVRSVMEEAMRRRKRRRNFVLAVMAAIVAAIGIGLYIRKTNSTIARDTIVMWIAEGNTVEETNAKLNRYQSVLKQFQEQFPQLEVILEAKEWEEIEETFESTDGQRPDVVETGLTDRKVLRQCIGLDSVLKRSGEQYGKYWREYIEEECNGQVPIGWFATVIYAEKGADMKELQSVSVEEFCKTAEGYCEADSRLYSEIQKNAAGRYQICSAEEQYAVCAELFSVYRNSVNKEKAALSLLEYMLTDSAQDMLHLQNYSSYMPMNENVLQTYFEIYSELSYLKEEIKEYEKTSEKWY